MFFLLKMLNCKVKSSDMTSRVLNIICMAAVVASCGPGRSGRALSYHFDSPAKMWEETFPLGNGRIGLMPDGGVDTATFVLNESSMWSGSRQNADNPEASKSLGEIRELLFSGQNDKAQELMYKTFTCAGVGSNGGKSYDKPYGTYQLFGNLVIVQDTGEGEVEGYRRELRLSDAIATESFTRGGIEYSRTSFASYKDDVGVIRLKADETGALDFTISMNRESNVVQSAAMKPVSGVLDKDLTFKGRLQAGTETSDKPEGMGFGGRVRVLLPKGGELTDDGKSLTVKDAKEAIVLVAMKTDYYGDDVDSALEKQIETAAAKSFRRLKKGHTKAFQELFGRVELNLGRNPEREVMPMDERLDAFEKDDNDPSLIALYYQFGRYLLISSTREGALPPNLQGLWARTIRTPWNCDYHLNINLEMNLWPAEVGNLSELQLPLVDWTKNQVESGRNTAKVFYNSRGWVTHVLGNVWQFTSPSEGPSWGATNTSAAWLCEHLYQHYQFTQDKDYLSDVYPTMKGAAMFFVDMLVENPNTHYLVTAPTTSPENSYYLPNGSKVNICAGSTMDNQIIRELFTNVIEASSILGVDKSFADTLAMKREKLMPTTIGPDGRIMEWLEPYKETDIHHRHVSHLYGLYPSNEISISKTPELAEAARKTLEVRGDQSTGWSMGWKVNFWARLHDGEHAYKLLRDLLHPVVERGTNYSNGGGTYPNLFCAHPPYQIDGNFGGAAGIAEMLIQSQDGVIELIPAIPASWKDGSFKGLCVRGGGVVDAQWKDGVVTRMMITARNGGEFHIKGLGDKEIMVRLKAGENWEYMK